MRKNGFERSFVGRYGNLLAFFLACSLLVAGIITFLEYPVFAENRESRGFAMASLASLLFGTAYGGFGAMIVALVDPYIGKGVFVETENRRGGAWAALVFYLIQVLSVFVPSVLTGESLGARIFLGVFARGA